ncbi:PQQ-binding-like beta-propeller repeat protein [Streptomyces sp. NPDC049577]|uniref:outer membrane protein assembly factor BamB family protein n=1 Tax=Streptomyces sp. NPDC049577 TaxID=3155153 RepID=UPI00342578D5
MRYANRGLPERLHEQGNRVEVLVRGGFREPPEGDGHVVQPADLALWDTVELDQHIEGLAFHPVLPLLGVTTEEGDEVRREGTLLLYEPAARRHTAHRFDGVGADALRWLDEQRLEVTFAVPDVRYERDGCDAYERCVARLEDGALTFGPRTPVDDGAVFLGDPVAPGVWPGRERLAALAGSAGRSWSPRDAVTAVEPLRDGRLLCVRDHSVLLECWTPGGELLWSVPVPDDTFHRAGGELYVAPDERTAWVTVLIGTSDDKKTLLQRVDLADGSVVAERRLGFPVVLSARTDGVWAARDSRDLWPPARWAPSDAVVFTPTGRELAAVALGEYDRRTDEFRVPNSPHLLFVQEREPGEKWVVRVGPDGIEPLFLFGWESGGHGVMAGDGLVHTGGTRLVRRTFPEGEVVWTYEAGSTVLGVDARGGYVYVVTAARELVTLRAEDGEEAGRVPTAAGSHVFTPLSLRIAPGDGELLIGTAEGRVLAMRAP